MSCANLPRRRSGYTLIELMVALIVAFIFAGVVFVLLQGQSRFVAFQGARQSVLENSRATVDIIGGDLRGVPPVGVRAAEPTRIRVMVPRAWGIVCAGSGTTLDALFAGALPSSVFSTNSATGILVDVSSTPTRSWAPARDVPRAKVTGAASFSLSGANACGTLRDESDPSSGLIGGNAVGYQLKGSGFPSSVVAGKPVLFYELVEYGVSTSAGDGSWVTRSNGFDGNDAAMPQPLAGPLAAASNPFQFTYYRLDASGAPVAFIPSTSADLDQIRRIKVRVGIQSRDPSVKVKQTSWDSVTIHLRNTL